MAAQPSSARLGKRVLSALVLIPVALAAILFSGPESPWLGPEHSLLWHAPLILLVAVVAGVLAWEWARLCSHGHLGFAGLLLIVMVLVAIALAASMRDMTGIWALIVGAALVTALGKFEHDA